MKILFKIDRVFLFLELLSRCINVSNVQKKSACGASHFLGKLLMGIRKTQKSLMGKVLANHPPPPGGCYGLSLTNDQIMTLSLTKWPKSCPINRHIILSFIRAQALALTPPPSAKYRGSGVEGSRLDKRSYTVVHALVFGFLDTTH